MLTRTLKWLGLVLAFLAVLLLAGYLATPALVARFSPQLGERIGFNVVELRVGYPSLEGFIIERLSVYGDDFSLVGENGQVRYRLSELTKGRIDSLGFASLKISINTATTPDDSDPATTSPQLLPVTPFKALSADHLTLEFPDTGFVGVGHAALGDGSLSFLIEGVEPEPASHFSITATLTQTGIFNARFGERDNPDTEFMIMEGAIAEESLSINGQVEAQGYVLDLVSSIAGLPEGSGTIRAKFKTRLTWPLPEALAWQDIAASLPEVAINWTSADNKSELKSLSGSMDIENGSVAAALTGTVRTSINDYAVAFQLPADYQLTYGANRLTGAKGLNMRANKADQRLQAEFRSFSLDTTQGMVIQVDTDIRANSDSTRATGKLLGNLTLASIEPTTGSGDFDFSGSVNFSDQPYVSDIRGTFKLSGDAFSSTGQLSSGIVDSAPFIFNYDVSSGAGTLEVTDTIQFSEPLAASVMPKWEKTYDLDRGQIDAELALKWDSFDKINTKLILILTDASGRYDDYTATGISATLDIIATDVSDGKTWRLQKSPVQMKRTDVGIPVDDVAFNLAWSGDEAHITRPRAALLGGRATASDFFYNLASGNSGFELNLKDIDLAAVLALEGDDILGSGRLNGTLPVTIANYRASVSGGDMVAAPPGGTIRLTPTIAGPSGQPGLDFALLALKDFTYSELNTEIDYAENGDLQLGVHLRGRNPAVENGRPIHYNLNISENVPVLLESLRLQDKVTERVESEVRK